MEIQLYQGDCLNILPTLQDGSINAIITDLPYGKVNCEWDEIIPFEWMWLQVKRLLKDKGVFVTTASQPFTSKLVMSNLPWFKYSWVWDKGLGGNFAVVKYRPFISAEDICVFSKNSSIYNPQMVVKGGNQRRGQIERTYRGKSELYGVRPKIKIKTGAYYPKNIIHIDRVSQNKHLHPTQKPVRLYEYLIKTYTNEGDTVLDFTMGSGTTGVACVQTNRNFIGVELEEKYFKIAQDRINHMNQLIRKHEEAS